MYRVEAIALSFSYCRPDTILFASGLLPTNATTGNQKHEAVWQNLNYYDELSTKFGGHRSVAKL